MGNSLLCTIYFYFQSSFVSEHPSSLGNTYYRTSFFEEAIKAYQELYKYCITDKDKYIALNDISSYYCMTDNKDSTITTQHKALEYAIASKDSSMIAISKLNLSVYYDEFEELDSALYHAYSALQWFPSGKVPGNLYGHLGTLLFEKGDNPDSAIYYLNKKHRNRPTYGLKFAGRVTLATTSRSNIDEAFSRRFQSVVYFPMPTEEQRAELWRNMLPGKWLGKDAEELITMAAETELSGGAITNVVRRCALRMIPVKEEKNLLR